MSPVILIDPVEREQHWDEAIELLQYQGHYVDKRQRQRSIDKRLGELSGEINTHKAHIDRLRARIDMLNDELAQDGTNHDSLSVEIAKLRREQEDEKQLVQETMESHRAMRKNVKTQQYDRRLDNLWHDDINTTKPRDHRTYSRPATALGLYRTPSAASSKTQLPPYSREAPVESKASRHPYSHYHTAPRARSAADLLSNVTRPFESTPRHIADPAQWMRPSTRHRVSHAKWQRPSEGFIGKGKPVMA